MFHITIGGAEYSSYIFSGVTPTYTDPLNQTKTLTFSLIPVDGNFIVPQQGEYVRLFSGVRPITVFTGFITTVSKITLLTNTISGYNVTVKTEEINFNSKQIGNIPAFAGQTAGSILIGVLNQLSPGHEINTDAVVFGPILPNFKPDPSWTFTTIATKLAQLVNYRWFLLDHTLYFLPQNDTQYGYEVVQTDPNFNGNNLILHSDNSQLVNDVTFTGTAEPQTYVQDSYLGDGTSNVFSLTRNFFGNTGQKLIFNDPFIGGLLNSALWVLSDPSQVFHYSPGNVSLTGGAGIGTTVLSSKSAFELGGELLFDHGAYTFDKLSVGIIGGLYNQGFTQKNCVVGFSCSGLPNFTGLQAVVDGVPVGNTFVTQPGHSYRLQTYISADELYRYQATYFSITGQFGGDNIYSDGYVTLVILDQDLTKPGEPAISTILYDGRIEDLPALAFYGLFNAEKLYCSCILGPVAYQLPPLRVRTDSGRLLANTVSQNIDGSWTVRLQTAAANNVPIYITYRAPGISQARLLNNPSIVTNGSLAASIGAPASARNSQDCTNLANSFLNNYAKPLFSGSYVTNPLAFTVLPESGRYIEVAVPSITPTLDAVVTQVTIQFTSLENELVILNSVFGFAPLLPQYVIVFIRGSITPYDFASLPQYLNPLGSYFTPSLTGNLITVDAGRPPTFEFVVTDINGNAVTSAVTEVFTIPRTTRNDSFTIFEQDNGGKTSRYGFVVNSTGIPIIPAVIEAISLTVGLNLDFSVTLSDTTDVAGVEVRLPDDATVFWDSAFTNTNPFKFSVVNSSGNRFFDNYNYHTFNRRGEYSLPFVASGDLPFPLPPLITLLGTEGQTANLSLLNDPRSDIIEEVLEVATDTNFSNIIFTDDRTGKFTQSSFTLPNPGTFYARGREADVLGFGPNGVPAAFTVTSSQFALSVKTFGAKGDGHTINDAVMNAGANTLRSLTANFSNNDIGKVIHVNGADSSGGNLVSSITDLQDPQNIVLADNAQTSVANAQAYYATDDSTSIVAAFAAATAGANGDTAHAVFFPAGSYLLTPDPANSLGEVADLTSGMGIYGEGYGSELRLNPPSGISSYCIFAVNNQSNVSIHDLKFFGDQSYQTPGNAAWGLIFSGSSHSNIHNCWFEQCRAGGISSSRDDTLLCNDNVFFQCGLTHPSPNGIGIQITSGTNFTLDSNKFDSCGQYGISLINCNPYTISNNNIVNCGGDGINEYAGTIVVFPQTDGGIMQGNTSANNSGNGISILGNPSTLVLLAATRIVANICTGNGSDGIHVNYSTAISIGENRCSTNQGNGIHLLQATYCKITHNNCQNNGHGAASQIFEDTGCAFNTIDNPEVDPSNIKRAGNLGITPQDAIVHQVEAVTNASFVSTHYILLNPPIYTIQAGDKLRFDVFIDADSPNLQYGLDFRATTLFNNNVFLSSLGLTDQNGLSLDITTDLTARAFGRWYQRVVDLSSLVGFKINQWFSSWDTSNQNSVPAGAVWTGRLANISIFNVNTTDTQFIVYSSGPPSQLVFLETNNVISNFYSAHISQAAVSMDFAAADGSTYLRAIQQTNYENMAQNPNFEASSSLPPPGWMAVGGAALSYITTNAYSGSQSLAVTGVNFSGVQSTLKIPLHVGDTYKVDAAILGHGWIQLICFDGNNNITGAIVTQNNTPGVFTVATNQGVVPVRTTYGRIQLLTVNAGGITTTGFDDILCVRVRSLIDEVVMRGAVPPVLANPGFAYTISNVGSIAWFWDGSNGSTILDVFRSDKTFFHPSADGVGRLNIAAFNLTVGLPYYFWPYVDERDLQVKFVSNADGVGGGLGTSGHAPTDNGPGIAFANPGSHPGSAQYYAGRIPLSFGALKVTLGTVGSTGGGYGGGQSANYNVGGCPRRGMQVQAKRGLIPVEHVIVGDEILTAKGLWTTVEKIISTLDSIFVKMVFSNDEELQQSLSTVMPLANGQELRSDLVTMSDIFIGDDSLITLESISLVHETDYKFIISCAPYHTFYCGRKRAGVLSHNVMAKY